MEKISVIIPTFGRHDTVCRAIDSALRQRGVSVEVIVVDDNNPQTEYRRLTAAVMMKYSNMPNVRYITHDQNRNAAAARNTGFCGSTGSYICFLDDDDSYGTDTLYKLSTFLEAHQQYHAAYCGSVFKGKSIVPDAEGNLVRDLLQMKTSLFTPALMFRRDVVGELQGFDERFRRHQDYEFLVRFFRKHTIGVVQEALVHIGANTGENVLKGRSLEACKRLFLETFAVDIHNFGAAFARKVYALHYSQVFISYVKDGELHDAWRVFKRHLLRSPASFSYGIIVRLKQYIQYRLGRIFHPA